MSTKIQINSLEALERLIGNDNELEIELRNSIVQQFAKKHLKGVVTKDVMTSYSNAIFNEVKQEFFTDKQIGQGYSSKVESHFRTDKLEALKQQINYNVNLEVSALVQEALKKTKIIEQINEKLENASRYICEDLTSSVLERRLDALVEKRLKEKLGLK